MEKITAQTLRNQPMELFKLLASALVVFIHTPFPGELGGGNYLPREHCSSLFFPDLRLF